MVKHGRLYEKVCVACRKETNPGGLPHEKNVRTRCPENAIDGDGQVIRGSFIS